MALWLYELSLGFSMGGNTVVVRVSLSRSLSLLYICTSTDKHAHRGGGDKGVPFSMRGPSLPSTMNRTEAFHSRGRRMQRRRCTAPVEVWAGGLAPVAPPSEGQPFSGRAPGAHGGAAPHPLGRPLYTADSRHTQWGSYSLVRRSATGARQTTESPVCGLTSVHVRH